jgi:hypothetical protein
MTGCIRPYFTGVPESDAKGKPLKYERMLLAYRRLQSAAMSHLRNSHFEISLYMHIVNSQPLEGRKAPPGTTRMRLGVLL